MWCGIRRRRRGQPEILDKKEYGEQLQLTLAINLRHDQVSSMTSGNAEIFYVDDSPDDLFLANYQMREGRFSFALKTFGTGIAAIMDMERRAARGEPLPGM
jgi:hypothetical protein